MNIFTKKSAFGAIAVAGAGAGLIIAGAAAPAMAATANEQVGSLTSSSDSATQAGLLENLSLGDLTSNFGLTGGELSNSSPLVFSPEVSTGSVETGDVSTGDTLSGNAVASGNDVTAPVASGNDVPVTAPVTAPVASGNETSTSSDSGDVVTDVVEGTVDTDALVDGILDDTDLTSVLGD